MTALGAYLFWNVGIHHSSGNETFSLKYPPHPEVLKWRKDTIRDICEFDPQVIKHEIEFLGESLSEKEIVRDFEIAGGMKI